MAGGAWESTVEVNSGWFDFKLEYNFEKRFFKRLSARKEIGPEERKKKRLEKKRRRPSGRRSSYSNRGYSSRGYSDTSDYNYYNKYDNYSDTSYY